mgnify:CR=1 FL=1
MVSCGFAKVAEHTAQGARRIREATIRIMSAAKTRFKRDWFILTSLVSKDFKLKYRRSMLGVLWSVLNPLLMMIVLTAVFSVVFRFDIPNFPVYLILGQTLFTFMSDATSGSHELHHRLGPLIKKIRINKMLFPLEKVVFSLLNFAISLIAVAASSPSSRSPSRGTSCSYRFCCSTSSCSASALGCCCRHSPCSSATSCIFGASC